jgi:hypothetical protein
MNNNNFTKNFLNTNSNNYYMLLLCFFFLNFLMPEFFFKPSTECMPSNTNNEFLVRYLPHCVRTIIGTPLYFSIIDNIPNEAIYFFTPPIIEHLNPIFLGNVLYRDMVNEGLLITETALRIDEGLTSMQIYNQITALYVEEIGMTPIERRPYIMQFHPTSTEVNFYIRELSLGYQEFLRFRN